MIKQKRQPIEHATPLFRSSEWIAHNAAMQHKRPLLGHGPKPVIGSRCPARISHHPAFFAPAKGQQVGWKTVALDTLTFVGAVAAFGLVLHIGYLAGF